MRIDVVSIFPQYLDGLKMSLIGKASSAGLLSITIHDLRDATTDKHRTVDDSPYGGGAGMVMKPEPWAASLEKLVAEGRKPTLVIPTPAGHVFTQEWAHTLSTREHLVFACGRYEGIDQRVSEWASDSFDVVPLSMGDYVLNGGEVAVMAMIEATARLIPGVIGNPESLVEESHSEKLLEYPVYTKPAQWRGLNVPEVLLSGNHAEIKKWRQQQQLERTQEFRPDLLP